MDREELYEGSLEEEARLSQEMMLQEEMRMMESGAYDDSWQDQPTGDAELMPVAQDTTPAVVDEPEVELSEDVLEDDTDVTLEDTTEKTSNTAAIVFILVVLGLIIAFVWWLIASGILWAIIKFIIKAVITLVILAGVIYWIYDRFF